MAKKQTKRSSMRDAVRKQAEERQQSGGGGTKFIFPEGQKIEFFKPEKGKMKIDIIPYVVSIDNHPVVKKGDLWYERTIEVHHSIGAEEKAYLCLKTIGKRCPICDDRAKMMKDSNSDEDIIKALTPKKRQIFNVIDLSDEKAGVKLWEYSYHLFGKLLETEIRESDENSGFDGHAELEGGYTLELRFKEKTMGKTKFLEVDRIDFKERDDYDEDILEDVLDLDAILNVYDYEKLSAIYFEQEEEPVKKSSKKDEKPTRKSSKKVVEEEDEEDEEEEPVRKSSKSKKVVEEEEDEEDEKPTRKSKSKPTKKVVEEEPEEEDDEEDDEKPVKKGKSSNKCPEGYEYGTDCYEYDECFDCDVFIPCKAARDAANPKKK